MNEKGKTVIYSQSCLLQNGKSLDVISIVDWVLEKKQAFYEQTVFVGIGVFEYQTKDKRALIAWSAVQVA